MATDKWRFTSNADRKWRFLSLNWVSEFDTNECLECFDKRVNHTNLEESDKLRKK